MVIYTTEHMVIYTTDEVLLSPGQGTPNYSKPFWNINAQVTYFIDLSLQSQTEW